MRLAISIAFGLVLAALAAGGYFYFAVETRDAPSYPVSFEIGGERLTLPSDYLQSAASDDGASGVALAAFFPDFKPAARFGDVNIHTDLNERFQRIVFLSLRPADPSLDPSERMSRLYERFLTGDAWSPPGGLTARAFEADSPFAGDELFYVQPEGREFAARCRRADPTRKLPSICTSVFRNAGLDVEMRFSARLLGEWSRLTAGARGLIEVARR